VFNNKDSASDIIERGAFAKTLSERAGRIAFCYQHDIWHPIGKIMDIREDEKGLWIQVMLSASEGDIQTKVKEDILKEMSIGYRVMSSHEEVRDGDQVNILTEIKLFEISLVTIAANPLALVESMKGEEQQAYIEKEFDRLIALVKNENINFEIQKLKSIVLSVPAPEKPEPRKEELENPSDKSIVFGDNFFTNNLKILN
jgi:HK97 family phage prohead protease